MRLSRAALEDIEAAGAEIVECMRALDRGGIDLVSEVLRGQGTFYELDHYPPDDVFDSARHSQYYYHAHRPGEHGHFHTFVRGPGMPPGATPVPRAGDEPWPAGDDAIAHLVAISMDALGRPLALFTVNRWVTGEAWYPAATVVRMLDAFRIDHASPSWPLNRWLTAMLRFYRPEIAWLLHRRDEAVADRARHHPGVDVLEDRGLEVTSELPIDIATHLTDIRRALRQSNP